MARGIVKHLGVAAVGAAFWAAALLLPPDIAANAQSALVPHLTPGEAANPTAAAVRNTIIADRNVEPEFECLAQNIYWEARGEPFDGMLAVAFVTLNRVADDDFPKSICGVVKQGVSLGLHRCQFSWACDQYTDRPRRGAAWDEAREAAFQALFLDEPDPTDGALYFHATRVRPSWARSMVRVGRIGKHVYYRQPLSVANDTKNQHS
ncbi:MAG: cell wall hydrolase [Rhodospirillales bacterium]|nr:cell wall hydrolase [Rhodospirillales bacterium]